MHLFLSKATDFASETFSSKNARANRLFQFFPKSDDGFYEGDIIKLHTKWTLLILFLIQPLLGRIYLFSCHKRSRYKSQPSLFIHLHIKRTEICAHFGQHLPFDSQTAPQHFIY